MAAILNFRIFAKNGKTQISFYLLNRARSSDFIKIFNPQGIWALYSWKFSKKNSSSQKWRPFWIFKFLPKIEKQKFASIFLTVQDRVISANFSTQPMQKGTKLK